MPNTEYTPYTKTTWQDGDQITTNKMMNIENGIAALSAQVGEALGDTYGSLNERMDENFIRVGDTTVTVAQGGTGATTAEDARVNLGLGAVLTDISTLQNKVNGIGFSELLTVAKTKTLTIQRADTSKLSAYMVLVGSGNDNGKTILIGHFTADGTPTLVSLRSASGVTIATPAAGKATIKNALTVDSNLYIKILVFYGTTLTYSIA